MDAWERMQIRLLRLAGWEVFHLEDGIEWYCMPVGSWKRPHLGCIRLATAWAAYDSRFLSKRYDV